jgi:probable HAF family extracellular repeat protein
MTDLGEEADEGLSMGINDHGDIVGMATIGDEHYAVLYAGGKRIFLDNISGEVSSSATAVNNVGEIVGASDNQAFLYYQGRMTSISLLPGVIASLARAINNSGRIVGTATNDQKENHAFLYADGVMTDLGTVAGGHRSEATGINTSGQVVGFSTTSDGFENAFIYDRGKMNDLGTMSDTARTFAFGINDAGQIVGLAMMGAGRGGSKAFIYSQNKGFQDLDVLYASLLVPNHGSQSGFTHLEMANGINNHGNIIGVGEYWDGTSTQRAGFLLRTDLNLSGLLIWIVCGIFVLALLILMLFLWHLPVPAEEESAEPDHSSSSQDQEGGTSVP